MWKLPIILSAVIFALAANATSSLNDTTDLKQRALNRTKNKITLPTAPHEHIDKRINKIVEAVLNEEFFYSNKLRSKIEKIGDNAGNATSSLNDTTDLKQRALNRTKNEITLLTAPYEYIDKRINKIVEAVLDEEFSYSNKLRSKIEKIEDNIKEHINITDENYETNSCVILFNNATSNATTAINELLKCVVDKLNSELHQVRYIKDRIILKNSWDIQKCYVFPKLSMNPEPTKNDPPDYSKFLTLPNYVENTISQLNEPSVRHNIVHNCSNLSGLDVIHQKLDEANNCTVTGSLELQQKN